MPWWGWLMIGIAVVLIAALVFLFIYGRKLQRKQDEAEKQMEAMKQQVSILVIDKQKKKMIESGLPDAVIQQTPKYSRRMKVPVVRAKIGPRVMNLIADAKVYEILPVKKTCTVTISGIYITELKSVRGGSVPKLPEKKKGFMARMRDKAADMMKKNR
ncbi:MAG: hypothetical protein IKR59_09270 [Lachnospiraceae bacterium]|nr:hypothetical protein [Lachnospiraceae bacterium]